MTDAIDPKAAIAPGRRNRSDEEFAMRRALAAWMRERWPGARIVHELVVASERRVDMAAIGRDAIIGVEIKSSRDTADRVLEQCRVFSAHLPLVVLATAPTWDGKDALYGKKYGADARVDVDGGTVRSYYLPNPRRCCTAPMLKLLWAAEARAIASRTRVAHAKTEPLYKLVPMLARSLTGDEIVREVCRELRARDAFPKSIDHPESDPPSHD